MKHITLAITGASGVIYGIRLLETLSRDPDVTVHLLLSDSAIWTISYETAYSREQLEAMADFVYPCSAIWEAPASGSFPMDAMVICPCSMKTLSAIKNGYGDNLITRAADVTIKENRQLILCPRETPLSAIHLDNMAYLAHLGVCILPPMPGFYQKPQTLEDLIEHHTMKVMDQLKLPLANVCRWGQSN